MHASFSSTVAGWRDFYMLAGSSSATFVGLIFVAVSLHLDLIGEAGISAIFTLARRTFYSFILVVIISLVFLIPKEGPAGLGWPLLALGVVAMLWAIQEGRAVVKELNHTEKWQILANRIVRSVAIPLLTGILLISIAANILAGTTACLYWLVPVVVLILSTASLNAWDLMLGLARHKARRSGEHEAAKGAERNEKRRGGE